MPVIPGLDSYVAPQGQIESGASANDFGAAVGQGLSALGAGVSQYAATDIKLTQMQDTQAAYAKVSQSLSGVYTKINALQNAVPPTDPNYASHTDSFTANGMEIFNDGLNKALEGATPAQQKIIHGFYNRAQLSGLKQLQNTQSEMAAAGATVNYNKMVNEQSDLVANDPTQYELAKSTAVHYFSSMGLTPEKQAKFISDSVPQIAFATGQSLAQKDPQTLLALAKGQKVRGADFWDDVNPSQRVKLEALATQQLSGAKVKTASETQKAVTDTLTALRSGQYVPNSQIPSESQLTASLGPVQGQQAASQIQNAVGVNNWYTKLSNMPTAEAESTIGALASNSPQESDNYRQAQEAYGVITQQRNTDYMGWAVQNGNTQPLDMSTPQTLEQGVAQRAPVFLAGAQNYTAAPNVFSNSEAAALQKQYSTMAPEQKLSILQSVYKGTGGNNSMFGAAVRQFGGPADQYAAALASSNQSINGLPAQVVASQILQGESITADKNGAPLALSKAGNEAVFKTAFSNAVGNIFNNPSATINAQGAAQTYQAVKALVAYKMYESGNTDDINKLTTEAVKEVVGDTTTKNGSTLVIPRGMDEDTFDAEFNVRQDAALQEAGLKGGALDDPESFHYNYEAPGVYGVQNKQGQALVGGHGVKVLINYNAPLPPDQQEKINSEVQHNKALANLLTGASSVLGVGAAIPWPNEPSVDLDKGANI